MSQRIAPEPMRQSAQTVITWPQLVVLGLAVLWIAAGLVIDRHRTLLGCIAAMLVFMLIFVGMKMAVWWASAHYRFHSRSMVDVNDPTLPAYTVLVPLFHEANMIPLLLNRLSQLKYPRDRLQVILLLEEDDVDTRAAAEAILHDSGYWYVEVLVVPAGVPQTKPRALNAGLEAAKGTFVTIYDAEDRPDPFQLLKAVANFRHAPEEVACLQARLQFWNEHASVITRFYRAEYCVHFEWILPGLAKLGLIEPLGGTSNHFRTEAVRDIGGWDAYNVTEDADMAGALAIAGYQVQSFDSWTLEEASKRLRSADKQRRRWLMGYTVTGLVYTRRPIRQARQMGVKRWFFFNLFMLGTPFCLIINPLFWGMTIAYFITGSPIIQHLWPAPLYIAGIILMIVGDLLLFYQMVFACVKQDGYRSVKYMLLLPFWWAFSSFSAYMMLYELTRHPHRWNKTDHEGRAADADEEEIAQALIA
jgi:cellulose synthase/poly-beta-1,6-N-acetylglucosamine synthase-like glycosyltransferase